MTILAYGLIHDCGPARNPGLTECEGRALCTLASGGLVAIYSDTPDASAPHDMRSALVHAGIVAALHQRGAVLPMRYGSVFPGLADLEALVLSRRAAFLAALDAVEGCHELGIRLLCRSTDPPGPDPPAPAMNPRGASGTSYLRTRQALLAGRQSLWDGATRACAEIRSMFAGLYRGFHEEKTELARGATISMNFLVPRVELEAFRHRFRTFQQQRRDPMLLSGPWPPYHFTGQEPLAQPD